MPDRIPIMALTGLANGYEGDEFGVGLCVDAATLVSVYLTATTAPTGGALAVELYGRDAVDTLLWTETGISLTLGELDELTAIDPLRAVAAGTRISMKVTDAAASVFNLQGWYELDARPGIAAGLGWLTSQARVLEYLGQATTSDGSLINSLIASVSVKMQNYMRRAILSTSYTNERHSAVGNRELIQLDHWPIIGTPTVELADDAVDAGELDFDLERGWVFYGEPGSPRLWPAGRRHISVDYTAGYATVPEDLADAATVQVVWQYKATGPKGDRLRERQTVADEVTTTYMVDAWAPEVREAMAPYVRREVARRA